jgi:hypothetical protein
VPTVPTLRVVPLERDLEPAWREFVTGRVDVLFYASLEFRDLLCRFLDAAPHYLVVTDGGRVRGALPCFSKCDPRLGTVLNSLPYYGSNGGFVTDGTAETEAALLGAYLDLERSLGCCASTIVGSPFEGEREVYEKRLGHTFRDSRIGQLTPLPAAGGDIEEKLFRLYDESARRNVRKARKSGVRFRESRGADELRFLHRTHKDNISAIGGLAKDWNFFDAVQAVSEECWSIFVAELDGAPVAGLLVFRFNSTVEYYTPAICEEFRSMQPLALLVHEAMCRAAMDGYRWWNWGGTWANQEGVYRFKKKWGARDMPYHYYCRLSDRQLLKSKRDALLDAFPGFFVVPFNELVSAKAASA